MTIADALGREPTRVELAAFDAQWSEHCSYKSSRSALRRLPTSGDGVLVGPGEDAGVVRFGEHEGERYAIVVAHESHNHPSQIVPFEGAATGVGGIVRDVLCMGAHVIALADALRFGDASEPAGHQRHVARAVADGISAYGNAIGVPNIAGDVYFHAGFNENCLVNVIALGLVKENEIVHSFAPPGSDGWPILLVGKATDASGFGGASFSSASLDAEQETANEGAVQVPDPFLKSVLMRACYRAFAFLRARRAAFACKDLGAGGIMGCSAEMCAAGGFGGHIDLDKVNAAQPDLAPEVLAVGETQERMLFVLPPDALDDVIAIFNDEFTLPEVAFNARAVNIGNVTAEKRYVLVHRGERVMDVDIDLLTKPPKVTPPVYQPATSTPVAPVVSSSLDTWPPEPLYRRYDSVVRGCSVLPRGFADAGVVAPIPGSHLGVALAVAGDPELGARDPRLAAERAVREAVRKIVSIGARPVALTDCLNFGNPTKPDHYAQFVAAVDGLECAARDLRLPFVSGNVSFYNESSAGAAIPASAIVACVGVVDDVRALAAGGEPLSRPHVRQGTRRRRVAVLVFPGTNSEEETLRLLLAYGADAACVHWSRSSELRNFDAFVLAGGFSYEDRIRAGAIAARDAMMEPVAAAARSGRLVLGICNGAQILLEAAIVPGGSGVQPIAAFTRNAPAGDFICAPVHMKLAIEPARSPITAALPPDAVVPAWAAHAEGRLAARAETLAAIEAHEELAFVYANADGSVTDAATPNGSALRCAGLVNREGNVLAIMPHPERVYPQRSALFESFVKAVEAS